MHVCAIRCCKQVILWFCVFGHNNSLAKAHGFSSHTVTQPIQSHNPYSSFCLHTLSLSGLLILLHGVISLPDTSSSHDFDVSLTFYLSFALISEIHSKKYNLLGVDLSQINTLEAVLKLCGVDFDVPTLLLSEIVLAYMTKRR